MEKRTALAIGAFDGLHLGHIKLIKSAVKQKHLSSAVLSFVENPKLSLEGRTAYIITQEEKEEILKNLGIENLFILDFSSIMNMTAEDFFIKFIVQKYTAKMIFCGDNFRFGKNAFGDINLLKKLCKEYDIDLVIVPYEKYDNDIISSTRIRRAIMDGDVKSAKEMLGRSFGYNQTVIKGNQIGRTIGTPTINQAIPKGFVLPKFGVYASSVNVEGITHCGVTNVGTKPSIGTYQPNCETWILDFKKDMYGMKIKTELLEFIRPEKKFDSLESLKNQIEKDAIKAREIFSTYI